MSVVREFQRNVKLTENNLRDWFGRALVFSKCETRDRDLKCRQSMFIKIILRMK